MKKPELKAGLIVILSWLLNPFLGIFSGLCLLTFSKNKNVNLYSFLAILIAITVALYQLSFPMPGDLIVMKETYNYASLRSEFLWEMLKIDFLSYGILALLSVLLPGKFIAFYILNLVIAFGCIWSIYKTNLIDDKIKISYFFALFLGWMNFQEMSHYSRQTLAILIFLAGVFCQNKKVRMGLIIASFFWHGSVLFLFPAFLLRYFSKNERSFFIVGGCLILISLGLSYVNFYELLPRSTEADYVLGIPSVSQRFLRYFNQSKYIATFDLFRAQGNQMTWVYLGISSMALGLAYNWRLAKDMVVSLIIVLTVSMVLFQFHELIFSRAVYALELILLLFFIQQIKRWSFFQSIRAPYIIFFVCLFKIHLFAWPLDSKDFFKSPLILLSEKQWEILK